MTIGAAAAVTGCELAPIDHDGQLEPCLPGFTAHGGRCYRALDAGDDAATPGCTQPIDCDGDQVVLCDPDGGARRVASHCDGSSAIVCVAGALHRAPCPSACVAAPIARCAITPSFDIAGEHGTRDDLVDLTVSAGETTVLETDTGRITRTVAGDTFELRAPGEGVISGIGYRRVAEGDVAIGVFSVRAARVLGTLIARGEAASSLEAQTTIAIAEDGVLDVSAHGA
ncbi:MAG: hypothetical protein M3Y87_26055, partial [Myxococcota bacterium]|nr:hypothetical protein [Myxococcota bacterium]